MNAKVREVIFDRGADTFGAAVKLHDARDYFTADNLETVLQEVGGSLDAASSRIIDAREDITQINEALGVMVQLMKADESLLVAEWVGEAAPYSQELVLTLPAQPSGEMQIYPFTIITATEFADYKAADLVAGEIAVVGETYTATIYAFGVKPTNALPIRLVVWG